MAYWFWIYWICSRAVFEDDFAFFKIVSFPRLKSSSIWGWGIRLSRAKLFLLPEFEVFSFSRFFGLFSLNFFSLKMNRERVSTEIIWVEICIALCQSWMRHRIFKGRRIADCLILSLFSLLICSEDSKLWEREFFLLIFLPILDAT
jgi:hypothetical protein